MIAKTLFVKHRIDGYVGVRDGMTRIKHLLESRFDSEGCRVRLPDGTIKIASPSNLVDLVGRDHTVEAHKQKLGLRKLAYLGFRTPEKAADRETHCRACRGPVQSSWGLECCACNGVICDCGTCLCGPKPKNRAAARGKPARPRP
jgi:hypothetical protein